MRIATATPPPFLRRLTQARARLPQVGVGAEEHKKELVEKGSAPRVTSAFPMSPEHVVLTKSAAATQLVAAALAELAEPGVVADVRHLPSALLGRFDAVFCNPTFDAVARASPSPHPDKRRANTEDGAALIDWIDAASRALKPRGKLQMIHRADRLAELFAALAPGYGDIETIPLWPRANEPAKRVILRARRDARGPSILQPGLVLHDRAGGFTPAAESVLRAGADLDAALAMPRDACPAAGPDA